MGRLISISLALLVGTAGAAEPPRWAKRAPLPAANSEMTVVQLDRRLYVIGGYPSSRVSQRTVQVYDAGTDSWRLTTPLPDPVNHSMGAAVAGVIYLIGGQRTAKGGPAEAGFSNAVLAFDPKTERWTPRAPMPTARSGGNAAVLDGKIYVVGGRPPRGHDFALYDPGADRWTRLPDLPTQRNHMVAAALNGKIYVVGGRFGPGFRSELTNIVEVYDPATNSWSTGVPAPTVRSGINGIVALGCLYVFGGEGNPKSDVGMFAEMEVFNPRTGAWRALAPIPVPVHGVTGAAFIDGWIHLPGGGISIGGSSGSTIHQVFRVDATCL